MEVTTFIWMFVVLKVPVVAALALIWWAIKEPEEDPGQDDGGTQRPDRDPRSRPPGPRRRGPHGVHPLGAPPRARAAGVRRRRAGREP